MSIEERMAENEIEAEETVPEPSPEVEPLPKAKARPVEELERVASVDVIRGVALLGILAMNIVMFAWPEPVYMTPTRDPDAKTLDVALWAFNHLVFDTKMMTIFSMLFGAGLILMSDRAETRGASMRGVYYRRVAWLLVIGLIHSYLIWDGDVLVDYALCGFLLYPFRKLRPRTLIITGVCFNLVIVLFLLGFRFVGIPYMQATAERVNAAEEVRKAAEKANPEVKQSEPHWWGVAVRDAYKEMKDEPPKREDFLNAIATHRSGYFAIVKERAKGLIWMQTFGFVLGMGWLAGGRMLIGMGLMKLGVFGANLSRRTYLMMMAFGYGIGVPLLALDISHQIANDFYVGHMLVFMLAGWPFLWIYGSVPIVIGHIGAVMLICQTGAIPWLTRRLAAVGRMALSNYLFDSILFTTVFYGYGFDLYGTIHRPMLYLMVLLVWTFQLIVSSIWLEHFRFGPAEWLWRSLTYWKIQPMRPKHKPEPLPAG